MRIVLVGIFWLLVWYLVSLIVNNDILLCSPLDVVVTLAGNVASFAFWATIIHTLLGIVVGFIVALVSGIILGVIGWRFAPFRTFFNPAVTVIKSVPIVCFIVLLLIWFGAGSVNAIAVFLVVFPAYYTSMVEGLNNQNRQLSEMLQVFRVPPIRKLLTFHWQTVMPYLLASSKVTVGMSWKAGVAAELIGMPLGTIGEKLYQAKILLSSADLFSWIVVIVIAALLCEKGFLRLLKASQGWAWRAALPRRRFSSSSIEQGSTGGEREPGSSKALVIRDLVKTYSDSCIINGFSRTFEEGGRYVLTDPSGMGKTTFLMILAGLVQADSGTIEAPRRKSMVFQEARVFEQYSAVENLRLIVGDHLGSPEIRSLLSKLLPPESLDLPLSQLSGGMRRRVELCRALAMPSELLLLDEPFAGLDDQNRELTYRFIQSNIDGRTLVMSSHFADSISKMDATGICISSAATGI